MELTKCLVVDDDDLGRELICQYLETVQKVDGAVDGADAVEKFRAACEAGEPYQLIFLDIMMPDMDGHAAGNMIRKIEKETNVPLAQQVKIVMLTALKSAQDVMQAMMEVRSAAYLVKPADPSKIRETLSKIGLQLPRKA